MNTSDNRGLKRFARFLFDFLLDDYLSWKILTSHFVPKKNTTFFFKGQSVIASPDKKFSPGKSLD
jgi:hypothetical protein